MLHSPDLRRLLLSSGLLIGSALVLVGGTVVEQPMSRVSIVLLGLGALVGAAGAIAIPPTVPERWVIYVALGGTLGIAIVNLGRHSSFVLGSPSVALTQVVAVGLAIGAATLGPGARRIMLILATLGVVIFGTNAMRIATQDPISSDVYELHEAASEALSMGRNPYTTANVHVLESHPFDDPEWINEYTYPPVALILYAGSSLLLGDSRIVGALAVCLAFALTAWFVGRWREGRPTSGNVALAVVALLVVNPATYLVVYVGFTEAIALPFFVLAAAWWSKRQFLSAMMLGLALASKQYFVIAAPLLIFLPDPYRWRRIAVVSFTAFATYLPFLMWDSAGLVNGVVLHHLTRDPRPDAASLAGLGIDIPTVVAIVVAVGLVIPIAHKARNSGEFLFGVGSALGIFTFLSIRGFRNSWWLVLALLSMSLGFFGRLPCGEDDVANREVMDEAPAQERDR